MYLTERHIVFNANEYSKYILHFYVNLFYILLIMDFISVKFTSLNSTPKRGFRR